MAPGWWLKRQALPRYGATDMLGLAEHVSCRSGLLMTASSGCARASEGGDAAMGRDGGACNRAVRLLHRLDQRRAMETAVAPGKGLAVYTCL